MKKTSLYEEHIKLNGKMVDFAGFMMPVSYDSIINEHHSVRRNCGIFDVSHMGQIFITGNDAGEFIQYIITNNISKLRDNKILYSPVCNQNGGTVDDILIYQRTARDFLIVVNASNIDKDYAWFKEHSVKFKNLKIEDRSQEFSMLALQGPKYSGVLKALNIPFEKLGYYTFCDAKYSGVDVIVSKTGYTGEEGVEIIIPNSKAAELWDKMIQAGREFSLKPAGLGARDTLRLEVCFSLYGHELKDDISPLEADIAWTVDMSKPDFIGKAALKAGAAERRLIGFEMADRAVPRAGYRVFRDGAETGFVTSGSFLPTLGKNMGLALVRSAHAEIGNTFQIEVRNNLYEAKITGKPFLPPFNKRDKTLAFC